LKRMAKRAMLGLARTGGVGSNGSGDYVIAFSTFAENRVSYMMEKPIRDTKVLHNDAMSPLFLAVIEATEEAIINSLFAAENMTGRDNHQVKELPVQEVIKMIKKER